MSPCIHGEVCREYLRQRRGIICQTCPTGCRFYEPKERTCRMTVLENARGNPRHFLMYVCSECHGAVVHDRYDPICFCPNCGRRVIPDA